MSLIDLLIIVLVIAWIGGFSLSLGGSLIHLLLVIVVIALIYRVITSRRVI